MILNLVCPHCNSVVLSAEKEKIAKNLGKKIKCKSCNGAVIVEKRNIRKDSSDAPQAKSASNKQQPNKQQPNKQQPNKQQPNKQQPNKQQPNKKISKKASKSKMTECKDCGQEISKRAKKCPHCGVKVKKSGCLIFVFAIIIVFVMIVVLSDPSDKGQSSTSTSNTVSAPKKEAISVTAEQIFAAYQSNEVSADKIYKGKLLKVSGIVSGIDSGFSGQAIVKLKTSGFLGVSTQGDKAFTSAAAQLKKGQKITMTCLGGGEVIGSPKLKDCVVALSDLSNPSDPGQSSTTTSNTVSATKEAISVTAEQIFAAYQSNEVSADNTYKGKLLKISGIVSGIDSGFSDQAIVKLKTSGFLGVSTQGDKAFTSAAAQLKKGQKITMTCLGDGEVIGSPMLKDCVIN